MKRLVVIVLIALPSFALAFASTPAARDRVISLLRAIEVAPAPAHLDEANGGESADAVLRDISDDEKISPHARWQAISELAQYPGSATEARLKQLIDKGRTARSGAQTLFARAAALSLAQVAKGRAVTQIAPLLDHPVPDVRADAARALAITGSVEALPALRARRQMETSAMVKAEIVEAISVITP